MHHFDQKQAFLGFTPLGSIFGLRSDYSARWAGPWLGFDFSSMVECGITLFGSGEWHWANYRANGHWKYVENDYRAHFRHSAVGYGAVGTLGFDWTINNCWAFGMMGNYQQWSTRKGSNRANEHQGCHFRDPINMTFPIAKKSHLERVKWTSYSISAMVSYRF
jgi:hypothetical protein